MYKIVTYFTNVESEQYPDYQERYPIDQDLIKKGFRIKAISLKYDFSPDSFNSVDGILMFSKKDGKYFDVHPQPRVDSPGDIGELPESEIDKINLELDNIEDMSVSDGPLQDTFYTVTITYSNE